MTSAGAVEDMDEKPSREQIALDELGGGAGQDGTVGGAGTKDKDK